MKHNLTSTISNFFIAGINYKKSDAAARGMFAVNDDQYKKILETAPSFGISSLFIISTCNRTEIYGFANNADQLIELLCSQTMGAKAAFKQLAYIKKGAAAVEHLFEVGAGLDSQILGDYEITGQLKQAVNVSRAHNFINCFLERLVNSVLQSSKMIKNQTALSNGSVSVSYTAVEYIKNNIQSCQQKNILVIGAGKIGRNTCKNLVDYLRSKNITLINRSEAKAVEVAAELGLKCAPLAELAYLVASSDIIIVAANAAEPIVMESQLKNSGAKLVIDLSIPYNVEPSAGELDNVTLVNVDQLSKINDETLLNRKKEIPRAKTIIAKNMSDFMDWYQMRQNAPALNAVKTKLGYIYAQHFSENKGNPDKCPVIVAERKIQQAINGMAGKLRNQNHCGCFYLEAINEFITAVEN